MPKPTRLLLPLLAAALFLPLSPAVAAPRPHLRDDCGTPGWTPSATRIDPADTYHPYVGNGYLGTRVPPAGAGYAASGEDRVAALHPALRRRVRVRSLRPWAREHGRA